MEIKKNTPQWFAVYTAPRAEKKVRERFQQSGIEHYLPVQMVTRKWHDRLKKVEQPVLSRPVLAWFLYFCSVNGLPEASLLKFCCPRGCPRFVPRAPPPRFIPDIR